MATTSAKPMKKGGWAIDWVGTSEEFQALKLDLVSDQAQGVLRGWMAFHLPGDRVRCVIRTAAIPQLANE